MKAIIGRNEIRAWLGVTMHDALLKGVDREHEETQIAKKCTSEFEGFICCRVRGHDGFHFSRNVNMITAVWENR